MASLGGIASFLVRPAVDVAGRVTLGALDLALAWPVTEEALERVLDSTLMERLPRRLADRLLAAGIADDIATRLVDGPELERIVAAAMDSPGAERIVAVALESRLVDEVVAQLLASKDLWLLVDEIARSPSVTEAISHQGKGFADEVAGVVRKRSQRADARVERLARRVFRRELADGNDTP